MGAVRYVYKRHKTCVFAMFALANTLHNYRQEKDIAIDEKFRRIDGAHRVSLACYHRAEYIYYDLYPYSFRYNSYAGEWMNMSMAALERRGLSLPELDFLEQANVRLREIGT